VKARACAASLPPQPVRTDHNTRKRPAAHHVDPQDSPNTPDTPMTTDELHSGREEPAPAAHRRVRPTAAPTDATPIAAAPGRSPLPTADTLAADCLDPSWVPPPGPWPTLRPGACLTIEIEIEIGTPERTRAWTLGAVGWASRLLSARIRKRPPYAPLPLPGTEGRPT
jgi:hypothetical protein